MMYKLVRDKISKMFMVLELYGPEFKPYKPKRKGNRGYFNNHRKGRK